MTKNESMLIKNIIDEFIYNSKLLNNPIIIYGSENDIDNYLNIVKEYITANSKKSLFYTTGDNFISSIEKNIEEIDIFILKNIEKLENNMTAQFKLFDIFNYLYDKEKQIIISITKTPDQLQNFEKRLITRLNWGIIIKI